MDATAEYDIHDKRYFQAAILECSNCETTRGPIESIQTADGKWIVVCEECAEEERRMEAKGDELAAMPSCEVRQRIIDAAESTAGLVNSLRAHDLAACAACASTRETVLADRQYVDAAAVCCEGRAA